MDKSFPYLKLNTNGLDSWIKKDSMANSLFRFKKTGYILVSLILIGVFYMSRHASLKHVDPLKYSIVIDAGSTGSRIHVFKLFHDKNNENPDKTLDIRLVSQVLEIKIKPGLSSYAKSPDQATESLKPLLEKALTVIPKEYQSLTHISLKATAGLRLISEKLANKILGNIENLFKKYPFVSESNDVGILDGKYEGIYSWLTLNYALNHFYSKKESTTCSLDLGGGSTQITFIPLNKVETKENDYVVDFNVHDTKYNIFAKSYLGFGLLSARMDMFNKDLHKRLQINQTIDPNQLTSVCIPSGQSFTWTQQGVDYSIKGASNKNLNSFNNCYKTALKIIKNKIQAPSELKDKSLYAFSFYYDRLKSANLIPSSGGIVKISEILQKALNICDHDADLTTDSTNKDRPFLCMDLTYIYTILTEGFGIPNTKEIHVLESVNNMNINWALGAAFHMLKD